VEVYSTNLEDGHNLNGFCRYEFGNRDKKESDSTVRIDLFKDQGFISTTQGMLSVDYEKETIEYKILKALELWEDVYVPKKYNDYKTSE
jgi:hypothetical protein